MEWHREEGESHVSGLNWASVQTQPHTTFGSNPSLLKNLRQLSVRTSEDDFPDTFSEMLWSTRAPRSIFRRMFMRRT